FQAMSVNSTGSFNVAEGAFTFNSNSAGSFNTAIGANALKFTTVSQFNTALGYGAGGNVDNGWNNVFIGANTGSNGIDFFNDVAIGESAICTASSQARIGNSSTTSIGGFANWSNISDGRVKKNIKQNIPGLAFINK